jgi:hypothetical protein
LRTAAGLAVEQSQVTAMFHLSLSYSGNHPIIRERTAAD